MTKFNKYRIFQILAVILILAIVLMYFIVDSEKGSTPGVSIDSIDDHCSSKMLPIESWGYDKAQFVTTGNCENLGVNWEQIEAVPILKQEEIQYTCCGHKK